MTEKLIPPGPFLVSAHGAHGLTPDMLRSQRFVAPSRGVRIPARIDDMPRALVEAATLTAPADSVLPDVEAARWWGLPLPPWLRDPDHQRPVVVATPAGNRRPRRNGVVGRRLDLPEHHITVVDGQRVTTVARTFIDCAAKMPTPHLIALGDAALHLQLVSLGELDAMVRWGRRRRGIRSARLSVPLLDALSESPGESLVRAHLLLAGLPRPKCNLDIFEDGQFLARADMAWPDRKVIVEYDGAVHLDNAQRLRDAARRNRLLEAGWLVITVTSADLRAPELLVAMVSRALNSPRRPR